MRRVILLASLLALAGCATGGASQGAFPDLGRLVRADVERARGIALAAEDKAGVACTDAILAHLPEIGSADATPVPPAGALSTFMLIREARRKVTTPVSEEIHIACAPLVVDAEVTLLRLGLKFAPAGGGFLPGRW